MRRYVLGFAVLFVVILGARVCGRGPRVQVAPDPGTVDAAGWPVIFPKMPDAKVITFEPKEAWFDMEFSAPGSPSEIIAYYTRVLRAKGWTTDGQVLDADQGIHIRFRIMRPSRTIDFNIPAKQFENGRTHVEMSYLMG